MMPLATAMQVLLDEANGQGLHDLIWYLTRNAEAQLIQELKPYSVSSEVQTVNDDPQFHGVPLWFISPAASHGFQVILGDQQSEWAIGITAEGQIREF